MARVNERKYHSCYVSDPLTDTELAALAADDATLTGSTIDTGQAQHTCTIAGQTIDVYDLAQECRFVRLSPQSNLEETTDITADVLMYSAGAADVSLLTEWYATDGANGTINMIENGKAAPRLIRVARTASEVLAFVCIRGVAERVQPDRRSLGRITATFQNAGRVYPEWEGLS